MTRSIENIPPAERQALAATAIHRARLALQSGDRRQARRFAEQAVTLAPNEEDPWLLLAAIASPRASMDYLQRALQVNPSSQRARRGMEWALERIKAAEAEPKPPAPSALQPSPEETKKLAAPPPETETKLAAPLIAPPPPLAESRAGAQSAPAIALSRIPAGPRTVVRVRSQPRRRIRRHVPLVMVYALMLLCLSGLLFAVSLTPYYIRLWNEYSSSLLAQAPFLQPVVTYLPVQTQPSGYVSGVVTETPALPADLTPAYTSTSEPAIAPSLTPTAFPVDTATPLPTQTALPTPEPTLPPSATALPTESPTSIPPTSAPPTLAPPTPVPPTQPPPQPVKKVKKKKLVAPDPRPANIQLNDHWIDVDLSSQTVFAMQGDQVLRSFVVSSGRWPTVTVTGTYRIYVKYRSADMSGQDYYLPDVPYVMYFYKGYGLHGTYWHNNFGTPMSHGCVNLRVPDAGWLFEFASVGTTVSIHE